MEAIKTTSFLRTEHAHASFALERAMLHSSDSVFNALLAYKLHVIDLLCKKLAEGEA